eukprot:TRINITY_DN1428_c0_g1_i1.p1 TRINITY_DN1428_c0_g1~~TRINITY_DN1428_c0_g1_i1.p1  ORF type:complete len:95 (-),score=45.54 TRINITY_DN1428_c0_g1_i1:56-340(-)
MSTDAHAKAMAELEAGKQLKHTDTNDKSGPKIETDVHIKKVDRDAFKAEVAKGTELKHAETNDRSTPKIEADAELNVKNNVRGQLLAEIKKSDS